MSVRLDPSQLADAREIVPAPTLPNAPRACTDRSFGLPVSLHASFFGLFLAYLGVMAIGFPHPEMVLPMAICVLFTVAFYVVPMLWATTRKRCNCIKRSRRWASAACSKTASTR